MPMGYFKNVFNQQAPQKCSRLSRGISNAHTFSSSLIIVHCVKHSTPLPPILPLTPGGRWDPQLDNYRPRRTEVKTSQFVTFPPHQPPIQRVSGALSVGGKAAGAWSWPLTYI